LGFRAARARVRGQFYGTIGGPVNTLDKREEKGIITCWHLPHTRTEMQPKTPEENAVFRALENPKYKWRTIAGISKETNVPPEQVMDIVTRFKEYIAKSSVQSQAGEDLYTLRSKFIREESSFRKLVGAIKNRID
jgi:hypothetical protein